MNKNIKVVDKTPNIILPVPVDVHGTTLEYESGLEGYAQPGMLIDRCVEPTEEKGYLDISFGHHGRPVILFSKDFAQHLQKELAKSDVRVKVVEI